MKFKKPTKKKKKPLLQNNFFAFLFFLSFFAIGYIYLFFFYPFFDVKSVVVEKNTEKGVSKEDLSSEIKKLTTENIFSVDKKEVIKKIKKSDPVAKQIVVTKKFPSEIVIEVEGRRPFFVLCKKNKEDCFYVDEEGVVFQRIDKKKNFLTTVTEKKFKIGDKAVKKEGIKTLFLIKREINKIEGLELDHLDITDYKKIKAFISDKELKIFFSLKDHKRGVENLKVIMSEIEKEKFKDLNYIDLRFGDRVFYK